MYPLTALKSLGVDQEIGNKEMNTDMLSAVPTIKETVTLEYLSKESLTFSKKRLISGDSYQLPVL